MMTRHQFFAWRRLLGLTQTEAGQHLGVSIRTVIRWENGQKTIPLSVELACELLSVRLGAKADLGPRIALNMLAHILYQSMEKMSPTPDAPDFDNLDGDLKRFYRNCVKVIANNPELIDRYRARYHSGTAA